MPDLNIRKVGDGPRRYAVWLDHWPSQLFSCTISSLSLGMPLSRLKALSSQGLKMGHPSFPLPFSVGVNA